MTSSLPQLALVSLLVAVLDGAITYLSIKDRDAWLSGNLRRALVVDALTTVAVGVSVCAFVEFTWVMIPPTVVGSLAGRYLAWRF